MPIQIQDINDENEAPECPLCMEPFEVDDINFFPCACGYQVCRFCWHRIRTDENGLCPACRTSYPENPAEFRPLTESDLQRIRHEKRQKEVQRRQKLTDCRRHLAAIRVLQKNLVFVVGLSQRLSDTEVLKRQDYFGKYGRIMKIVVNTNTAYAGPQGPSASAYITYSKMEEALRAIQSVNNIHVDGRTLKASLGTTKYCSTYLKNQQCHKTDCMYLHELADEESSFTKEDMQAGKHQELEQRLIDEVTRKEQEVATTPAPDATQNTESKGEKSSSNARGTSGSSWHSQSVCKAESSWLSAASQNGEQTLSSHVKSKEPKNSPKVKSKKHSPRHTSSKASTPTIDALASDSSRISSECSSVTTTPPPPATNLTPQDNGVRLPDNTENQLEQTESSTTPHEMLYPPSTVVADPISIIHEEVEEEVCQTNQRFHQVPPEDPINLLSYESTPIPLEQPSQPLQDTIPIQSTNDWEAAFGFTNGSRQPEPEEAAEAMSDSGDNDFGFDPWVESSKGLADLLEKEGGSENESAYIHNVSDPGKPNYNAKQHSLFSFANPNNITDQSTVNHFGIKPNPVLPDGFSPDPSHHQAFGLQGHGIHTSTGYNSPLSNKGNFPPSPTKKGLSEWQNGLRALLPTVNINFAMDSGAANPGGPLNNLTQSLQQHSPMQHMVRRSSPQHNAFTHGQAIFTNRGFDENSSQMQTRSSFFPSPFDRNPSSFFPNGPSLGTAAADRYNTNIAPPPGLGSFQIDPAIVSSGNKTPVKQTPPSDENPHWMRSLQALVDTDNPVNSPSSTPLTPQKQQQHPQTSPWPVLAHSNSTTLGAVTQPPPGFQNSLSYSSNMDYAVRHSLLENQS